MDSGPAKSPAVMTAQRAQRLNQPDVRGLVKLTVRIPADVHRALKIESAETRQTIADIIVGALVGRIHYLPREKRVE